jgi:hypothetical protein
MDNKVEGGEVSDPFEAGEICAGLSHAYRIKVMQVLVQLGGKAKLADFFVSSPWVRHISRRWR